MPSNTQQVESILRLNVDYQDGIKAVGQYINEIKRLKDEQKSLDKAFKDGAISEQQYGDAMAKNKAVTTQLNGEMKVLTTEIRKKLEADKAEQKQIDINTASYNKLSQTYTEMKKKINGMDAAERQRNKAYIDQSKAVYERMKALQAETGKMQLNVGNYQAAITAAITGNSKFASSLMGIAGGATSASGALGIVNANAMALGQTLMTLLANPVFLAIAGIAGAGMAFSFWKEYNDGLAEASRLTAQFTGLAGDAMDDVRDSVQATADTFGKDFKETLQATDAIVSQFGVSWEEANDIINKGFAAGADINGDFLSKVQQFAPALKDAGLSAEELVAVIQQTRSGIFGTDGLQLISKAGQSLRNMTNATADALRGVGINADEMKAKLADGSLTTMQAIQQISAALKTVGGNTQEAGAIISDVFGKKGVAAGQEQIKAFANLNMSLDSLIEKEGEYGKTQQELVKTQEELNKYTSALFGMDGWDVMRQKAELLAKKGLLSIIKGLVDIINYMIDWYNDSLLMRSAVNSVVASFKTAWTVIKTFFNLVIDAVKGVGNQLRGFGNIIEGIFTFSADKIKDGWATLTSAFAGTWRNMALDAFAGGRDAANNYIEGFNKTVSGRVAHIDFATSIDGGGITSDATITPIGPGGGGSSSGGSSRTGKSGKTGGSSSADEKARREAEAQKKATDKLMAQMLKAYDDQTKAEVAAEQKRIELKLAIVKKGSEEELRLKKQQLDQQQMQEQASIEQSVQDEMERAYLIQLVYEKFAKQRAALNAQYQQQQDAEMAQAVANDFTARIQAAADDELEQERIKLEQLKYLRDNARQMEGESIEAFNARKLQLEQDYQDQKKSLNQKEIEMEQAKINAIAQLTGAIGNMFETLGKKNRDALVVSKVLAIAEVAIQQGIAIANTVRAAAEGSKSVWEMLAQIAVGIATVTANIVNATKTINSAKFAKGGLIQGPGTGTSDSITAQVSNGESIMTANATALFSPLLSAINQMGGGVPIVQGGGTQVGEDMLAAAIAKGYAMAPSPVVSVREITDVGNRVQVIEDMATL